MSELAPMMTDALENGGEAIFTISGRSMLPLLHHRRDKVLVVKAQAGRLKKYDIPLYVRKDGKYVMRRIVAVKRNGYVLVGDNQIVKEYPVSHAQVLEVVKGFWRNGQYVSCKNVWYQAYCRIWVFLYPIRWAYLSFVQCIKRSMAKLKDADCLE